jgi:hypothetical protein
MASEGSGRGLCCRRQSPGRSGSGCWRAGPCGSVWCSASPLDLPPWALLPRLSSSTSTRTTRAWRPAARCCRRWSFTWAQPQIRRPAERCVAAGATPAPPRSAASPSHSTVPPLTRYCAGSALATRAWRGSPNPSSGNATSGRMLWPCSGALDCSLNGHCGAGGRCTCSVGWKGLKCGELDVLAVNKSQLGFVPAGSGSSWGGAVTRSHHDTAGERILYPTVHSMAPPPISAGLSCPRLATETLSCDRLEDVRGKDDQQLRNQQLVDEQSDRTSSRPVAFRSVHRGRDSGAHVARLFDRAWYCTGSERGACGGSDDGRGERQCERCTIHQLHGWEHAAWPWLSAPGANSHDLFTSCTQRDTDIRPWLPRPCESFDLKRQLTLCCFALFYRGASAILDQYRDAVIRRPG